MLAINDEENKHKRKERFDLCRNEIEFILDKKRKDSSGTIVNGLKNKTIPYRVTHNDTKLSNILYDKTTNQSVCLIDLDTIMPGSLLYDFGEGIRTASTLSKEDEEDLSKVRFDIKRFTSYTKGFINSTKEILTQEEVKLLPLGAKMMTYENGIRFLTDFLNGDIYFNVNKEIPNHNLIRAKTQLELLKQMEQNEEKMKDIILEIVNK
jgi:thiamine kinase-like enzyme